MTPMNKIRMGALGAMSAMSASAAQFMGGAVGRPYHTKKTPKPFKSHVRQSVSDAWAAMPAPKQSRQNLRMMRRKQAKIAAAAARRRQVEERIAKRRSAA